MPKPTFQSTMFGSIDPNATRIYPTERQASAMSAIGGGLTLLGPYGTALGTLMQIPDVMYDTRAFYENPTFANGLSLLLDWPISLSRYTNHPYIGKFDDWFPYGGIVDDASSAVSGNSIGEHIINAVPYIRKSAGKVSDALYKAESKVRRKIRRSLENAGGMR